MRAGSSGSSFGAYVILHELLLPTSVCAMYTYGVDFSQTSFNKRTDNLRCIKGGGVCVCVVVGGVGGG